MSGRTRQTLSVVGAEGLPEYPEALEDPALVSNHFCKVMLDRWFGSRLYLTAPPDVRCAALELIFLAHKQVPYGSLPDDDVLLAALLRMDLAAWRDLRARPLGPLYKWERYRARRGVVLGHPLVIDVCCGVAQRREARELSRETAAIRKRQERLRERLREVARAAIAEDDQVVVWLDQWLVTHITGNRTQAALERALEAAHRAGVLERHVRR